MTKEQYRYTYGPSDAVECQSCGEFSRRQMLKRFRSLMVNISPLARSAGVTT